MARAVGSGGFAIGTVLFRSLMVGLALLGLVASLSCEGDTYTTHLRNGTDRPLLFAACIDEGCSVVGEPVEYLPEAARPIIGQVGTDQFWQVTTEKGQVLGCFALGFESRPKNEILASRDLEDCPVAEE